MTNTRDHLLIKGIRTNNLKNLDVKITYNSVTCITGISGGGKTSLGFDTIYQLCHDEFNAIENGHIDNTSYIYDSCYGIIPSVAIEQENRNNNPRSSIYTYLNIASLLYSDNSDALKDFGRDIFKLQSYKNICTECEGLGYLTKPDLENSINTACEVKEIPFIPFRKNSRTNKLELLFDKMCQDENMKKNIKYRELNNDSKNRILFGKHKLSEPVRFKDGGRSRSCSYYTGLVDYLKLQAESGKVSPLHHRQDTCSRCRGSRINSENQKAIIYGMEFVDLLTMPFDKLLVKIGPSGSNNKLVKLLNNLCVLGLGYLTMSRSIPTLSGGELQKLKFSKLLYSNISGIMIVIDEISSQVHPSDYKTIYSIIRRLSKSNTIILIEHNSYFIERSDHVLSIGPYPGSRGGKIVEYVSEPIKTFEINKLKEGSIEIQNINRNNVINQKLVLRKECINLLVGKSGSGKTSIASYIADKLNYVEYINQKTIASSYKSTIASYLSLTENFHSIFADKSKLKSCRFCSGTGLIKIARSFDSDIEVTCSHCDGKMYSKASLKLKEGGLSIFEYLSMEVNDLADIERINDKKIKKAIGIMSSLHLSHLCFSRKIRSLSSGETKRLKLLKSLLKTRREDYILIVDEPGAGLDDRTCISLMDYLHFAKKNYRTVIVIDHKPAIFTRADVVISVGPGAGEDGGNILDYKDPKYYYEEYLKYTFR